MRPYSLVNLFETLFAVLCFLSCYDKKDAGFILYPADSSSSENAEVIERLSGKYNLYTAYSAEGKIQDTARTLCSYVDGPVIIRGEFLMNEDFDICSWNKIAVINPPEDFPGYLFNTTYAFSRASDFADKTLDGNGYAIILPDSGEMRNLAAKYFGKAAKRIFLKHEFRRYNSCQLEEALSLCRGYSLIIHYSGYSSGRIRDFCGENGIKSASIFGKLALSNVNVFSAEEDYSSAAEFICENSLAKERITMPDFTVSIRCNSTGNKF